MQLEGATVASSLHSFQNTDCGLTSWSSLPSDAEGQNLVAAGEVLPKNEREVLVKQLELRMGLKWESIPC